MAETYKVTAPLKGMNRTLWGVVFSNSVATGVKPGMALDSFRTMGYEVEAEKPKAEPKKAAPKRSKSTVEEIKEQVEAAKAGE